MAMGMILTIITRIAFTKSNEGHIHFDSGDKGDNTDGADEKTDDHENDENCHAVATMASATPMILNIPPIRKTMKVFKRRTLGA